MSRITELLELVKKNPDLPIIPMVDAEIVGDDYSYWLGEWGNSEVTEYYIGEEKIHFKYEDDEDVLNDIRGCKPGHDLKGRDIYELSDEEWDKLYASLFWEKAIVVWINA